MFLVNFNQRDELAITLLEAVEEVEQTKDYCGQGCPSRKRLGRNKIAEQEIQEEADKKDPEGDNEAN